MQLTRFQLTASVARYLIDKQISSFFKV